MKFHNRFCYNIKDVILPLVLLGIRDSNDTLVGETLKALSVLVSVLGAEKVIGKRKKVFADGSPSKSKSDGFSVKSKVIFFQKSKIFCVHSFW